MGCCDTCLVLAQWQECLALVLVLAALLSNMQQWWCTAQYAAVVHCPICSGGALPNMQGAVGTPSSTDQLIDVRPHQDLSSALPIQRKEKEKTHSVFSSACFSKSTGQWSYATFFHMCEATEEEIGES